MPKKKYTSINSVDILITVFQSHANCSIYCSKYLKLLSFLLYYVHLLRHGCLEHGFSQIM